MNTIHETIVGIQESTTVVIQDRSNGSKSLTSPNFDIIFTNERIYFFPVKNTGFWRDKDWTVLGMLGGPLGITIANSSSFICSGVSSLLKKGNVYWQSEIRMVANIAQALTLHRGKISKVSAYKQPKGFLSSLLMDTDTHTIYIHYCNDESNPSLTNQCYTFYMTANGVFVQSFFQNIGLRRVFVFTAECDQL